MKGIETAHCSECGVTDSSASVKYSVKYTIMTKLSSDSGLPRQQRCTFTNYNSECPIILKWAAWCNSVPLILLSLILDLLKNENIIKKTVTVCLWCFYSIHLIQSVVRHYYVSRKLAFQIVWFWLHHLHTHYYQQNSNSLICIRENFHFHLVKWSNWGM